MAATRTAGIPVRADVGLRAIVAVWMGRRAGSASRFLVALAATLATAFLFGTQAFVNYWFLIGTLALIAVSIDISSDEPAVAASQPLYSVDGCTA